MGGGVRKKKMECGSVVGYEKLKNNNNNYIIF